MKISACIITKNEERNIEKCINSFKDVCYEIIVTDTGSDDQTIAIAKALGATIYEIEWMRDFSYARNYGIDRATGDWILIIDADEYFEPPLSKKNIDFLEKISKRPDIDGVISYGYNLVERDGSVGSINSELRFFKNGRGIRFIDKVHEHLITPNGNVLLTVETDKIKKMHTGYISEVGTKKAERNLKILLEMDETTDPLRRLGYLVESYLYMKDYKNCVLYADKLINHKNFEWHLFMTQSGFHAYLYKIMAMLFSGDQYSLDDIGLVMNKAMEGFSEHPQIRYISAYYQYKCNNLSSAINDFEYAFELHNNYDKKKHKIRYSNDFAVGMDEKYLMLGKMYEEANDLNKAKNMYYNALERKINNFDALAHYIVVEEEHSALNFVKKKYNLDNEMEFMEIFTASLRSKKKNIVFYLLPILMERYPRALAGRQDLLDIVQEISQM